VNMCKLATNESKLYEPAVVVTSPVMFCAEITKPTTNSKQLKYT